MSSWKAIFIIHRDNFDRTCSKKRNRIFDADVHAAQKTLLDNWSW